MEPTNTVLHKEHTVETHYDVDPSNPRKEFDHVGKMVCFHKRYDLGDKHDLRSSDFNGWEEMQAHLEKEGAIIILPLHLYDHSGITMSIGGFSCSWDSGQVGFIYVTREAILEAWGGKRLSKKKLAAAEACLRAEVEEYDSYLTGRVFGYIVKDPQGQEIDSCWGFYSEKHAIESAKDHIDAITKQAPEIQANV